MRANARRLWTVLGILFAGMCLVRVFTVWAAEDVEEVYANQRHGTEPGDDANSDFSGSDERAAIFEAQRAEIRLSRPEEAAARVTEEEGQALVPGVKQLWARERAAPPDSTTTAASRGLASVAAPGQREASPDESARDTESHRREVYLSTTAMEPKAPRAMEPKTPPAMEPQARSAADEGLSKVEQPLPNVVSRGFQEIGIIVTDYGFFPNRVPVIAGVPVKAYLATTGKQTACFMLDEAGVKKGVAPGKVDEVVFTPKRAGTIRFYCPMKSIEGWLVVKEAPSAAEAAQRARAVASAPVSTADLEPTGELIED